MVKKHEKLNCVEIKAVETFKKGVGGLLDTYRRIFSAELGTLRESMQGSKLESQRHQNSVKLVQFPYHCSLRWTKNWIVSGGWNPY